jgi:hypothetical protein
MYRFRNVQRPKQQRFLSTGGRNRSQRPRARTQRPRINRGVCSWSGFEKEQREIRDLATAYFNADRRLAERCRELGWGADAPFYATVSALKQPVARDSLPEARAAAQAQSALEQMHKHLVSDLNLNFHLVRQVWASILNPAEATHCAALVRQERNLA